jgi:hypothetical protein
MTEHTHAVHERVAEWPERQLTSSFSPANNSSFLYVSLTRNAASFLHILSHSKTAQEMENQSNDRESFYCL